MTVATSLDSLLEKLKVKELYLRPSNWDYLHSQSRQFLPPTRASPPSSSSVFVSSPFTLFMFVCVETWALHFAWVARIGNLKGNDLGNKKYQFYCFEFSTRCTVLSYGEIIILGKITTWCSQITNKRFSNVWNDMLQQWSSSLVCLLPGWCLPVMSWFVPKRFVTPSVHLVLWKSNFNWDMFMMFCLYVHPYASHLSIWLGKLTLRWRKI